jgi:hypothetical protein
MKSFRTHTRFSFFKEKSYFCHHIAECANITESFLRDIGKFGDIGTFGDMGTEVTFLFK